VAAALVGSVGTVHTSTSGAAGTPSFPQTPTAGNLIVLIAHGLGPTGNITADPSAPSGYSIAVQKRQGTVDTTSIFYKVATSSETAPQMPATTGYVWQSQLMEFSGLDSSTPLDVVGVAGGTTSTQVATASGADVAGGELVIAAAGIRYSSAQASTSNSFALNNGATANATNNNTPSSANKYVNAWGITTGNGAADSATFTFATTSILGAGVAIASFKLAAAGSNVTVNEPPAVINVVAPVPTVVADVPVVPGVVNVVAPVPTIAESLTEPPAVINLTAPNPVVSLAIPTPPAVINMVAPLPTPTVANVVAINTPPAIINMVAPLPALSTGLTSRTRAQLKRMRDRAEAAIVQVEPKRRKRRRKRS
jgi:hypothetical protein